MLYAQTPETVAAVARQTEHPLLDIQKRDVEHYTRNWTMDYAFAHALHYATEKLERVLTFQEFQTFCAHDPLAQTMLSLPASQERGRLEVSGLTDTTAWQAVRWRIGIAYYSYLREAYAIAVLREAEIDAHYHVLADALWRVDFWIDDLCIELFVSNHNFKSTLQGGRKSNAEDHLRDGGFRFARVEMERRSEFGHVHLPSRENVLAATVV